MLKLWKLYYLFLVQRRLWSENLVFLDEIWLASGLVLKLVLIHISYYYNISNNNLQKTEIFVLF